MSSQNEYQKKASFGSMGAAMSLGLVLRGLYGNVVDNKIIIAGGALILGMVVGLALEKKAPGSVI